NNWLLMFADRSTYRRHLKAIAELNQEANVRYAEPNLVVQLNPHACVDGSPATPACATLSGNPTNDPWSVCQDNLDRQSVRQAWCLLEQPLGPAGKRGSPAVCIATADSGLNR